MIAILGGGITGLSAAYQLKKSGIDFILLEQEDNVGGKIKTIQKEGYTCELGPNTVLINNLEIKTLLEELGLYNQIISPDVKAVKNRYVLKNGHIEPIPTSLPSAISSDLIHLSTVFNVLKERFKKAQKPNNDESLASFIKRRFGNQIYEDLLTPFVTGIYAGDPERMSINYVLNILKEAEEKHGSVLKGMIKIMKEKKAKSAQWNLPKQKIFTFKNGLQTLINSLKTEVESQLQLSAQVLQIVKKEQQYIVKYSQNNETHTITVDGIISTLPSHVLAKVHADSAPSLSEQLNKINNVPALVVHLGYKKEQLSMQNPAFGILSRAKENVPFLGVLFNSRFFPHTSTKENELLTVICGGYRYPEILQKEDEQIINELTHSLKSLLQIDGEPNFVHIKRWDKGIPQYELGYSIIEEEIKEFEINNTNFKVGGNFYNGISVSDCVKNGINLANQFS